MRILSRHLMVAGMISVVAASAHAQQNGGGNNNNNNNQNNASGIKIDARGIVAPGFVADQSQKLDRKRQRALAAKSLVQDLNRPSESRKLSLVRLEAALEEALTQGRPLSEELTCLAGLQRIDHIFVDTEGHDLILAGPADGFAPDAMGRLRGVESGRPTLRLDDLLVALRVARRTDEVGCSIDPRPENLAALSQFVAQNSSAATPQLIEARFRRMADVLGLCDVRVMGVPETSRFGRLLLEADYRMKRISMGLENPGVKGLRSHLSMLSGGGNSVQRWWFVPLYEGLYRSDDALAFELVGQRVQLMSQEELTNARGERLAAATTRLTTQAFAKQFTDRYPDLAEQSPIFAELQNLFDWCIFAALLERENWPSRLEWKMTLLLDAERLPTETGPAPKQVPAIANSRRASSGSIVGLVGGGVVIHPAALTAAAAMKVDPSRRIEAQRSAALSVERSPDHPWWWD